MISRNNWKKVADEYKNFIDEHIPIIGWEEIEAYRACKEAREKAESDDSQQEESNNA